MVPRFMLYAEGLERFVLGQALFGEWITRQWCFHAGRAESVVADRLADAGRQSSERRGRGHRRLARS